MGMKGARSKMNHQEAHREINYLNASLDAQYRHSVKEYQKQLDAIQNQCEHKWRYVSDPSGNNDSGYICEGCGKEK
jgi:uncharacterized ferritin-like protein (DUF455 family)